jgi:hypothetical protein
VIAGPSRRDRDERGFVAAEFALGFAVLLVPMSLVVLALPSWSERQAAARAIAREVARAVARDGFCNTAVATGLTELMAANLGVARADLELALDCRPGRDLDPGGELTVGVTVRMPGMAIPVLGAVGEWRWTAEHRQPVDAYGSAR